MSLSISDGMVASFHYTLTNDTGDVLDSSQGRSAMPYLHGASNIVPGLERQMTGKVVGDKFDAKVPAAEAYGEKQGPGPQPVPKTAFPPDLELQVGMMLQAQSPDGHTVPVWVTGVSEDVIHVDGNHPLAGVDLTFAVEVTEIRNATEEEKAHGHPHGPGGHHH